MHVKKTLLVSLVVLLGASVGAWAAQGTAKDNPKAETKTGTVTRLDSVGKTLTVTATNPDGSARTGAEAKVWTIAWDDATQVEGRPLKEGELVQFRSVEKEGKTTATWIKVGKPDKTYDQ